MTLQEITVKRIGTKDIPRDWKVELLKNVTEKLVVGFVGTCDPYYTKNNGIPMIRTTNVKEGYLDLSNLKYVTKEFHEKNKKSQLQENDLIVARHGENGAACLVKGLKEANCLSVVIIRPKKSLWTPQYFEFAFNSPFVRKQIGKRTGGGVQTVVNTSEIAKISIPIPKISEQQKIASILSNVNELIKKTEQIIEQTQRLKKGLMQTLLTKGIGHTKFRKIDFNFGRTLSIPEIWNVSRIRDIIEHIQSGFASGERDENGITQLRMNNITDDGNFDFSKLLNVPIPVDIKRYDIKKDDILFNNTNSLDLIGKSVIANTNLDYTFSNHITRIRTNNKIINPYYLFLILLRYKGEYIFRSICNTHVGQSGIGKNELTNLLICYPQLEEQNKITNMIKIINSKINSEIIDKNMLENLKKGLMQQLLTGKIRVKV